MTRFNCDYGEGCHPRILERLAETNLEQTAGYGEDAYTLRAEAVIRTQCEAPDAGVHFVTGGTQANLLVIAAALRPHQAVIAPVVGHICVHEAGAIEATGHKVITLPAALGKLCARQVCAAAQAHLDDAVREHTVQPGLVYISHPTEYGTLYTAAELAELGAACRKFGLYLYMDGARLGYGLCASGGSLTLPLIAEHCHAFTIGGTKVGALFGEAVVIPHTALNRGFRYIVKQRGARLAKGRLLGLQFLALMEEGLYYEGARHAIRLAGLLAGAFAQSGFEMLVPPESNQLFPILPNAAAQALAENYVFEPWEKVDETHTAVRFALAWSTPEAQVLRLIRDIENLRRA
jgi:threonine aldolase